MAIDPNNPLELHPTDAITLRDFATSPPDVIVDELLASGGQTLITRQGRFVAMIEPISQDEKTQADLAARYMNYQSQYAVPTPREDAPATRKSDIINQLVEQARKAAEQHEDEA